MDSGNYLASSDTGNNVNPQLDSNNSVSNISSDQVNMSRRNPSSFLNNYGMNNELGSLNDPLSQGLNSGLDSILGGGPSNTSKNFNNIVDTNSNDPSNSLGMNPSGISSLLSDVHSESTGNADFNFGNLTNDNTLQSQIGNNINTNYVNNDRLGRTNDTNLQYMPSRSSDQVPGSMLNTGMMNDNFNGGVLQHQNNSIFELRGQMQNDMYGGMPNQNGMPGQNSMQVNSMNQMGNMNNVANQYQQGQRINGIPGGQYHASNMGNGANNTKHMNHMGMNSLANTNTNQYQQHQAMDNNMLNNQQVYGGGKNRGGGNMRNVYGGNHGHGGGGRGHHGHGRNQHDEETRENKLFIGMIPRSFDESDLFAMFTPFGPLQEIHLMRNTDGVSKGCAFVKFQQADAAINAIKACNNTIPPGSTRCMVVKYADVKTQQSRIQDRLNISMEKQQQMYMNYGNAQGNPFGNGAGSGGPIGGGMTLNNPMNPPFSDVNNGMNMGGNNMGSNHIGGPMGNNQPNPMSYTNNNVLGQVLGTDLMMQNMENRFDSKTNKGRSGAIGGPMGNSNLNYDSNNSNSNNGSGSSSINSSDNLAYLQHQTNQTNQLAYTSMSTANKTMSGGGRGCGVGPLRGVSSLLQDAIEADIEIKSTQIRTELANKFHSNHPQQNQKYQPFGMNNLQSSHTSCDSTVSSSYSEEDSPESSSNRYVLHPEDASKLSEGPEGANLFIYHLPKDLNEEDLRTLFTPFGDLLSVQVFVEKITNESKGFGFVSYNHASSAEIAIKHMDGCKIGARKLVVEAKQVTEDGQ
jgi:CUG-BP- and ETR3-like factor